MITLTLQEAHNIAMAYPRIPTLNVKASYDLKLIYDQVKVALRTLNEQKLEIITQHGGEVMPDGVIKWGEAGSDAADRSFGELMTHEIEIARQPIKLASIMVGDDPTKWPEFSPALLSVLEKIIVE